MGSTARGEDVASPDPSDDQHADRRQRKQEHRERLELLREAAYQAEYATGRQEDTVEEARRHIILRLGTIVVGFVVLLGGLVMLVLPGPGILGVLAGLGILSRELPWAERIMEYVKERANLEQLKEQPSWVQATMWSITVIAVAGSIGYFVVVR